MLSGERHFDEPGFGSFGMHYGTDAAWDLSRDSPKVCGKFRGFGSESSTESFLSSNNWFFSTSLFNYKNRKVSVRSIAKLLSLALMIGV